MLDADQIDKAEIDKADQIPTKPRVVEDSNSEDDLLESKKKKTQAYRLTPIKTPQVKFWHGGEKGKTWKPETTVRGVSHAKRSDQFAILLSVASFLILLLVGVTLYLNSKKYLFATSKVPMTSTAVVDFYQGNHAFNEKVQEEKAAKKNQGHEVHGITRVNDDLEVPLVEQINSMSEKMKKMEILQRAAEEPPPSPDTGPNVGIVPVKPTQDASFISPLQFNKSLPKALRDTQSTTATH